MIPEGLWAFALLSVTSLFAITNPLSAAPIYLALTHGYTHEHQRRTLRIAILTGAVVLVVFALLGAAIFALFGITVDAFRIAGGLIIFAVGMDMLQARRARGKSTAEEEEEGMTREEVGVTPLGIPMIVGPGAITTVMVLMADADTLAHMVVVLAAIALVLGSIYATLGMAPRLIRLFGQTGLNVVTRIMGLLLTVIAIQFIVDGVRPSLIDIIHGPVL
jgi:multiple antibiotic resistance protein